ncbi:Uncharacterised protein [Chlamydia abortus]|nr:Uncharacterised protein [Chlamydia abortus]
MQDGSPLQICMASCPEKLEYIDSALSRNRGNTVNWKEMTITILNESAGGHTHYYLKKDI